MSHLPSALVLLGVFLLSASTATAVWSMTQVLLDRLDRRDTHGRRRPSPAVAARGEGHFRRAMIAATLSLGLVAAPTGIDSLILLLEIGGALAG